MKKIHCIILSTLFIANLSCNKDKNLDETLTSNKWYWTAYEQTPYDTAGVAQTTIIEAPVSGSNILFNEDGTGSFYLEFEGWPAINDEFSWKTQGEDRIIIYVSGTPSSGTPWNVLEKERKTMVCELIDTSTYNGITTRTDYIYRFQKKKP